MSDPIKTIRKLTPREEFLKFRSAQFALDFASNENNRTLMTAAFAQWAVGSGLDPAMHYKIAGVKEFLEVLLSFGEPVTEKKKLDPDELEPQ